MIRAVRILVATAVATVMIVPVGTAHAAPADLVCSGTRTATYSPGLTLIPAEQTITTNENDAPCVSASVPAITSGHTGVTITDTRGCLTVAEPASGVRTFTWNTGQTSVFSYNRTASQAGSVAVVTLTGTITEGVFAGDTMVEAITGPGLNLLDCLSPPGITSNFAITTLTIT